MICYNLICDNQHEFEAWFSNSSDFDKQSASGLIACPHCASHHISKAIMAPNISTSRQKEKAAQKRAKALTLMNAATEKIRQEIAKTCDYVGVDFPEEARAIHYGERPERAIYGQASHDDVAELQDEGIEITPLPQTLVPKSDENTH